MTKTGELGELQGKGWQLFGNKPGASLLFGHLFVEGGTEAVTKGIGNGGGRYRTNQLQHAPGGFQQ
jgi:hypothetical protein